MEAPPPPVQMIQLLSGFQVSQALYVAAKIGVADKLVDGPRPAVGLASDLQCDPIALSRLLRTLASLGVFSETAPGVFDLTPLGTTLVSDSEGSMRDLALMWMETHYLPFAGLLDTVRSGNCAATAHYGEPFFSWLSGQPEHIDRFSRAMANLTDGIKAGAIASYAFPQSGTMVDVGGADGALLARVLEVAPDTTGIVFDLPHVIAEAAPTLKSYGLGDRMTAQGGDFFESVPEGADAYLLSMVLHDWNDDDASRLLTAIKRAAVPGSRVLAFELVMPAGDEPHMSKMIDLTMLGMLNGRERTDAEMRTLFEGAGFTYEGVVATPTPISIVEARVP
ncbi:MAG TPA: methyltransferase [Acidimicrobiales bacterium]|nr:methyltransferase [Acidimicrobiales bacterium]